jgi:glycosyl transferase family 1
MIRHVVLVNPKWVALQYGMLRDLEDEIVRLTGAQIALVPRINVPAFVRSRIGFGQRFARLRGLMPRASWPLRGDVLWVVLMGPENSDLDLLRGWSDGFGTKILYLFDTFETQLPALRKLLSLTRWDVAVTSFNEAVPTLERETGIRWHCVPQGVLSSRFQPLVGTRPIPFSAYGRREPRVHKAALAWARRTRLHYDFTVSRSVDLSLDSRDTYEHYAWHLRNSVFSFCWPVELTNPSLAGSLYPITCRWFEGASAGTVIVGRAPNNPAMLDYFGPDLVVPLDPDMDEAAIGRRMDELWEQRAGHLRAAERRAERRDAWTWEARVREMLRIARLPEPPKSAAGPGVTHA